MNYGEREKNPMTRIYVGVNLLLNQKNYMLYCRIAGIDEINENIRLRVWNDTEDHTEGKNDDKMYMNDKEHQKRDQELPILV